MKFHFNWGTGILMVIILFVGIMISIIVFSMNQQVNLVSADYYPKGVDYDKQIEKSRNLQSLNEKIICQKTMDSLVVSFPKQFDYKSISGSIHFYYMTDFEKDMDENLSLNKENKQFFLLKVFNKGRYILKFDWKDGEKSYYQEIDLNL